MLGRTSSQMESPNQTKGTAMYVTRLRMLQVGAGRRKCKEASEIHKFSTKILIGIKEKTKISTDLVRIEKKTYRSMAVTGQGVTKVNSYSCAISIARVLEREWPSVSFLQPPNQTLRIFFLPSHGSLLWMSFATKFYDY